MTNSDFKPKTHPVSLGQQAMYIHSNGMNEKIYHIDNVILLEGKIDLILLNKSLKRCINDNIVLSHTIIRLNGELRFTPILNPKCEFQLIDVKDHENKNAADIIKTYIKSSAPAGEIPLHGYFLFELGQDFYYFVHRHHHIYSDLLGEINFISQLFGWYAQASAATELSASTIQKPPSYNDYIVREQQYIKSPESKKDKMFWSEWFKNPKTMSMLPYDHLSDSDEKKMTEPIYYHLDSEIIGGIYDLAQTLKIAPYRIIISVFLFLLSKIQNETQHTIGFSNHGRHHSDDFKMLGYCINTTPFMTSIDPDSSCTEAVKKISADFKNHISHYKYPVSLLSSYLGNAQYRDSGNPLFKISVNVLKKNKLKLIFLEAMDLDSFMVDDPDQYGPLKMHRVEMGQRNYAVDDIVLHVIEDREDFTLIFNYEGSRYSKKTIERFIEQFNCSIVDLLNDPDQPVKSLNSVKDPQELLELSKCTTIEPLHPSETIIPDLIHGWSISTPLTIAVRMGTETLSYSEFDRKINVYANHLIALGVRKGDTVGVNLHRSLVLSSLLLAIMRAGAVYLPLDSTYPIDRLKYMSQDSAVSLIITDDANIDQWQSFDINAITLPQFDDRSNSEKTAPPNISILTDDLAYVIYTSGSTGKPKGVEISHRGAINLAYSQRKILDLSSASNVLGFASISFDASIWEMLMAFGSGGTFVTASRDETFPGEPLQTLLTQQKISHVTLPPSVLAHLPENEYPHLSTIIVAGEACSKYLVNIWGKDRNFFNAYGPTESTVCATIARCTPEMSSVPIGRPIGETRVYVLDSENALVAPGIVGELHISGPLLARGYRNKPELTQASFIKNPWAEAPYDRLYKTGDLVRWNSNDQLEYIGRGNSMIKLRGYRIELQEIEATLVDMAGIIEAVVKLIAVKDEEPYLAAYIVLDSKRALDRHEIKQTISKVLPEYMLPAAYVQISALPLNPSGKINKDELPVPVGSDRQTSTEIIHVSNAYEMTIAEVWKAILNLDHVGKKDNFFDLGGHSLLLLKTQDLIQKTLKVDLATTDLFKYSTVESLAEWIKKLDSEAESGETTFAEPLDQKDSELRSNEKKSRQQSLRSKRLKSRQ
jgi:amino acid adenylation domain-containing protein